MTGDLDRYTDHLARRAARRSLGERAAARPRGRADAPRATGGQSGRVLVLAEPAFVKRWPLCPRCDGIAPSLYGPARVCIWCWSDECAAKRKERRR
jgi:hypothetical protein